MRSSRTFFLCVLFYLSVLHASAEETCTVKDGKVTEESFLSVDNFLDENGEWETSVSTYLDPRFSPNNTKIDVKRSVVETEGKKVVHLKISMKGLPQERCRDKLRFYPKGAKNVVVSANGTVVKKIHELEQEGYGGVLTNRPLRNDERFEVLLDKLINTYKTSLGLGVTYHNHKNIDYSDWMMCGTIMLYNNQLYESGTVTEKGYGPNLRTLKVGDRVGLMKKSNGDLHFYVNGKELGPIATGIHYPIHGVLDLYGNAVEVTLL